MIFFNAILMAIQAILRNKVRSFLTAIGIVIGVASVIIMVHIGQAATKSVTDQISSMGPNLLMVNPGTEQRGPGGPNSNAKPFTLEDAQIISEEVSDITVAPITTARSTIVYGNTNYATSISGTDNNYFEVRDWTIESGRPFEDKELIAGSAVCVLGATVVKEVYKKEDPIGTSLRVDQTPCTVIGVLKSKGSSMGQDQDDIVLMPIFAVQRRLLGSEKVQSIQISAATSDGVKTAQSEIEEILRERRGIKEGAPDNFYVRNMQELSETLASSTAVLTALLGAIAGVSLLVGGIGIMNIMLVSVTERTREIGIRMAIGARAREVLLQFLTEAVVLSVLGGVIGISIGVLASWFITGKLGLSFVLYPPIITIAFLFSAGVGVLFGYVPARKAARLHPIEALRYE
jgi:putative ABC transport system permease protein